jgi:mycoredoxin
MNTDVVLYTRPGCPYCYRLRRGLRRRRVPFGEINIRHDSVAAAEVRTHANGTETVPTVRVGGRWLVNPTAAAVSAAAGNRRVLPASATSSMTGASADTQLPLRNPGPADGHGAAWLRAFRDWITPPRGRLLCPFGIRYAVLLRDRTRRRASRQE